MKAFLYSFLLCSISFFSCHRKTAPDSPETNSNNSANTEIKKVEPAGKPLIVVDGQGTVVSSKAVLLANGAKSGFASTAARAFTPQERANLLARFKTVPPRVMHVPDRLSKKAAKGEYYVLREKFWYWKKPDGFYYLDENYYK